MSEYPISMYMSLWYHKLKNKLFPPKTTDEIPFIKGSSVVVNDNAIPESAKAVITYEIDNSDIDPQIKINIEADDSFVELAEKLFNITGETPAEVILKFQRYNQL